MKIPFTAAAFGLRTALAAAGRFPLADFEETERPFDRFITFFIHPSFVLLAPLTPLRYTHCLSFRRWSVGTTPLRTSSLHAGLHASRLRSKDDAPYRGVPPDRHCSQGHLARSDSYV
ncbi:MAG: hypothetical protein HW395_667 [candidate division NC10 bacterium]|nr:hypothetical protein [candidate division NC10 bacterium]